MLFEAARKRLPAVYPHLFPVLLFFALEIQNNPRIYINLPAIIISCVLLYAACLLLFAITGKAFLSGLLVSVVLLLYYTVNFYRYRQTGQVLLPQDLNLVRHLTSIAAFSRITIHWQPACSILSVAALQVPLFRISKSIRMPIRQRVIILSVTGVFLYLAIFTRFSRESIKSSAALFASDNVTYNEIYREQGAIIGFCTVGVSDDENEPPGYNQNYMSEIETRIRESAEAKSPGDQPKPNVIVVMSESFWDPTNLPEISFSQDPVPNLHSLSGVTASGNVVAPTFGGMTCNTEYEFLTGNAMSFAGYGDIPYFSESIYVDRDSGSSLVNMFRANGYSTVALHTYTATFFNRDAIYPKLGFDAFIAAEDLPGARMKGSLHGVEIISDEYFCDVLIDMVECAEDPLFLFGITVQNHTPYLPDKYETTQIQADSGGVLPDEDTAALETYLEGVYDADAVLGRLFDYVSETEEPTILLYFGDHLPLLTEFTGIYTDLGYVCEGELADLPSEEAYKMYTTPYLAFSNFAELPDTWGDISTYYLGAVLADAAGIEMNLYYHFLNQAYEEFQALNPYIYIAAGEVGNPPGEDGGELLDMFAAIQYDMLFGQGFINEAMAVLVTDDMAGLVTDDMAGLATDDMAGFATD